MSSRRLLRKNDDAYVFWSRSPKDNIAGAYDIRASQKLAASSSFSAPFSITNAISKANHVRALPHHFYPPAMNVHTGHAWDIVVTLNGDTLRYFESGSTIAQPVLKKPVDGAFVTTSDLEWEWAPLPSDSGTAGNIVTYTLEVATEASFSNIQLSRALMGTGGSVIEGVAPQPFSATGGTITTSGGFTIHTFRNDNNTGHTSNSDATVQASSDTFTPNGLGFVEVLVIGGGGAGGNSGGTNSSMSGGGGAGGFIEKINHFVTAQDYVVTVGAGGPIGPLNQGDRKGGDSSFDGIIAIGGGGGTESWCGNNGGSGSGSGHGCLAHGCNVFPTDCGGRALAGSLNGGTYFGNIGGNHLSGSAAGHDNNGGGGGAGGPGGNGVAGQSGAGGPGRVSSISGSAVTYAGGGGGGASNFHGGSAGGAGGSGGGGAGGISSSPQGTPGQHHTGSAGGGSANFDPPSTFVNGGSGTVIIRYPTPTGGTWSPADACYYWRVRGDSSLLTQGEWSKIRHFCIDNVAPNAFQLSAPLNGVDPQDATPTFTWTSAVDPD